MTVLDFSNSLARYQLRNKFSSLVIVLYVACNRIQILVSFNVLYVMAPG